LAALFLRPHKYKSVEQFTQHLEFSAWASDTIASRDSNGADKRAEEIIINIKA